MPPHDPMRLTLFSPLPLSYLLIYYSPISPLLSLSLLICVHLCSSVATPLPLHETSGIQATGQSILSATVATPSPSFIHPPSCSRAITRNITGGPEIAKNSPIIPT